jgi:hypothetical protein
MSDNNGSRDAPGQDVSRLTVVFCVISAALLIAGIYVLLNLQQTAANAQTTLVGAEDAATITARTALVQVVFTHQFDRAKFVTGVIFSAFLFTLSFALMSQGFHSASQECDLSSASVPPSIVELREKRKWIYLIPGVILALCSTLILSLSLSARLPGDPLVRPPQETSLKKGTNPPASTTPTP